MYYWFYYNTFAFVYFVFVFVFLFLLLELELIMEWVILNRSDINNATFQMYNHDL